MSDKSKESVLGGDADQRFMWAAIEQAKIAAENGDVPVVAADYTTESLKSIASWM